MCIIFILDQGIYISGAVIEAVLMSPRVDWQAYCRAEERASHSIVRLEVHIDVVCSTKIGQWRCAVPLWCFSRGLHVQ